MVARIVESRSLLGRDERESTVHRRQPEEHWGHCLQGRREKKIISINQLKECFGFP
jgi:hypothetical protein